LFERKHLVQTFAVLPFSIILILLIFGFHVLLVFLLEWLTFKPKRTSLLHISLFLALKTIPILTY